MTSTICFESSRIFTLLFLLRQFVSWTCQFQHFCQPLPQKKTFHISLTSGHFHNVISIVLQYSANQCKKEQFAFGYFWCVYVGTPKKDLVRGIQDLVRGNLWMPYFYTVIKLVVAVRYRKSTSVSKVACWKRLLGEIIFIVLRSMSPFSF